jgi:hypothetical protein
MSPGGTICAPVRHDLVALSKVPGRGRPGYQLVPTQLPDGRNMNAALRACVARPANDHRWRAASLGWAPPGWRDRGPGGAHFVPVGFLRHGGFLPDHKRPYPTRSCEKREVPGAVKARAAGGRPSASMRHTGGSVHDQPLPLVGVEHGPDRRGTKWALPPTSRYSRQCPGGRAVRQEWVVPSRCSRPPGGFRGPGERASSVDPISQFVKTPHRGGRWT